MSRRRPFSPKRGLASNKSAICHQRVDRRAGPEPPASAAAFSRFRRRLPLTDPARPPSLDQKTLGSCMAKSPRRSRRSPRARRRRRQAPLADSPAPARFATLDPASGAPLTTLVGVASDAAARRSSSCRRSRAIPGTSPPIRAPRCFSTEAPERGDPLNHPRSPSTAGSTRHDSPRVARPLSSAKPQGEALRRFRRLLFLPAHPESVHFNGGFGRADALTPADILTPAARRWPRRR